MKEGIKAAVDELPCGRSSSAAKCPKEPWGKVSVITPLLCGSKPAETRLAIEPIGFDPAVGNIKGVFLAMGVDTNPGLLCIEPIIVRSGLC